MTVLSDVIAERARQDQLWGVQDHTPAMFLAILTEEVGEVAKEIADTLAHDLHGSDYRTELVQVAAVAVAAIEAFDRMSLANPRPAFDRKAWLHEHVGEPFPPGVA